MSSLEEELGKLDSQANRISNIKFKRGYTALTDMLISRKRRYVRDADENENLIASISMGEPISRIVKVLPTKKNIEKHEIIHILHAAAKLNEICKSSEIEERIQNSLAILDEKFLNIELLNETREQHDREIDDLTRQNTERNSGMIENTQDLKQEELEIERLEKELKKKKMHTKMLVKRKEDYILAHDINQKTLQYSTSELLMKSEEIKKKNGELEQHLNILNQRISSYEIDDNFTAIGDSERPSTCTRLHDKVCILIDNLSKYPSQDSRENIKPLTSKLDLIEKELKEILTTFDAIELNEKKVEKQKSIYYQLLSIVNNQNEIYSDQFNVDFEKFNEVFPHNTNTTVPQLPFSKDSSKFVAILLKLYTEGDTTLKNLAAYMEEFAKEHGLPNEPTNTAIYSLVAANLLVIDRTHKDSLVKLKLTL